MTPNEFRKLALEIPGATESAHMNHPDFRAEGKIFATLGYPDDTFGMVKLTPEQQQTFVKKSPTAFRPCKGVWGERGATNVILDAAKKAEVKTAMKLAVKNVMAEQK